MPVDSDLDIAIMWLESSEGDKVEAAACKAVAEWLIHEQGERRILKAARRNGVSVARLRRKESST
jgi:hypothetical protein